MEEERSSAAGLLLVTLQDRVKGLNARLDGSEEEKAHLRLQLEDSSGQARAANERWSGGQLLTDELKQMVDRQNRALADQIGHARRMAHELEVRL